MTAFNTQGDAQRVSDAIETYMDRLSALISPASLDDDDRPLPRNAEAVGADTAPAGGLCPRCGAYWHCEHQGREARHEERPAAADVGPGFKWQPEPWQRPVALRVDSPWPSKPVLPRVDTAPTNTIAGLPVAEDVARTWRYAKTRRLVIERRGEDAYAEHELLRHIMDALIFAAMLIESPPGVAAPLADMAMLRAAAIRFGPMWAVQYLDNAIEGRLWERLP